MTRKIIQITANPETNRKLPAVIALCDDGAVFASYHEMERDQSSQSGWTEWFALPDIPQDEPVLVAKAEPAASINPIRGTVYGTKVILTNDPGCLNLIISADEAINMGSNILEAGISAQRDNQPPPVAKDPDLICSRCHCEIAKFQPRVITSEKGALSAHVSCYLEANGLRCDVDDTRRTELARDCS